jgi:predicted transposase YbfD/YdcC
LRRRFEDWQTATTFEKAHGRRERRTITTSTGLNDYLDDWPKLAQVIRVQRERTVGGETSCEVVYFITSLDRSRADAATLLGYIRAHWHIENRLHHVRDATMGEDACRVRTGSSPQVLAALRNTTIHLLEGVEAPSNASAMRRFAAHPNEAILLLRE